MPAVHAAQSPDDVLPASGLYVPALQAVGAAIIAFVQNAPARHGVHAYVAAPPAEKEPAWHWFAVPVDWPATQ